MPITLPTHKRGDTYGLHMDATGAVTINGVAVTDLAPFDIAAQVRTWRGVLVTQLEVVRFETGMTFAVRATAAQTELWPTDTLKIDVQFALSGVVVSSQTFAQPIEEDVTRA